MVRAKTPTRKKPKFGTLKGRIKINDPDWWKPMNEGSRRFHRRSLLSAAASRHCSPDFCGRITGKLTEKATSAVGNSASTLSVLEIAIKSARGKLGLSFTDVERAIEDLDVRILPY
jgi:hypothetical protein